MGPSSFGLQMKQQHSSGKLCKLAMLHVLNWSLVSSVWTLIFQGAFALTFLLLPPNLLGTNLWKTHG